MAIRGVPSLNFNRCAAGVRQGLDTLVKSYEATIDDIVNKTSPLLAATGSAKTTERELFLATFGKLADADGNAALASAELTLPALVSGHADIRAASSEAKKQLQKMWSQAYARSDLYKCLHSSQGGAESAEEARLVKQALRKFQQAGAALPSAEARAEVGALDARCSTLAFEIEQNINEDCTEVRLSELELSGCGEDFVQSLPFVSKPATTSEECSKQLKSSDRMCSVKAPVLIPILRRATAEARRKMLEASQRRCMEKNTVLLDELVQTRHSAALAAGFKSHSERMLAPKMAQSLETAENFCVELMDRIIPLRDADYEKLTARKRVHEAAERVAGGEAVECKLHPWDVSFYSDLLKREEHAFDDEKVKEFFPLVGTIDRLLQVYAEMLGMTFKKTDALPKWHDEVVTFEVLRGSDVVGHLYLDQFPRDGKFGHQMIVPLAPSFVSTATGERCVPACVNISNLPRPQGDKPALLRFAEMQTLFHELGHVMHCLCTSTSFSLLSWAWPMVPWPGGVEQDFLEVPSMALEKFACEPELLARVAKHYKSADGTDAPKFDDATIATIKNLEKWMVGVGESKYFGMALFDLRVHSKPPPYSFEGEDGLSVQQFFERTVAKCTSLAPLPNTHPCASWYHLVIGYDAGYYGYRWSDVYAADVFQTMLSSPEGLLSAKTGGRLRDEILGPCATRSGGDMLRAFLGREPSSDAWCERNGVPKPKL